jgi:hypothetical protein
MPTRDESWLLYVAPLADAVRDPKWQDDVEAVTLRAFETAVGSAEEPLLCFVCELPYAQARVPEIAVAIENTDDPDANLLVTICGDCAECSPDVAEIARAKMVTLVDAKGIETLSRPGRA